MDPEFVDGPSAGAAAKKLSWKTIFYLNVFHLFGPVKKSTAFFRCRLIRFFSEPLGTNGALAKATMKIAPKKLIGKFREKVSSKVYAEPGYMNCTNILVLDDTAEITRVLDRFARMEGFDSLLAASISKAYEFIREEQSFASLRMAFLDIEVGTGLGFEIYNAIRVKNPGLPIVIMSGSFYHKLLYPILACDDCVSFLPKPFSMQSIRHLMREPLALGGDMSQLLSPENLARPRAFLAAV